MSNQAVNILGGQRERWKEFFLFPLLIFQGGATSIQLETLHFLDLSRGDSHLQYRNSGEVRRGEEKAKETWKSGGSRKNDS